MPNKQGNKDWFVETVFGYADGGKVEGRTHGAGGSWYEKPLDVEDVPGLARPSFATPDDTPVGKDELGNVMYRTPQGKTYTVKPEGDRRTTGKKVVEGVKGWVDKGMPLPSLSDVGEVIKQAPVEAYKSAAKTVRNQGTLGDVLGITPAVPLTSTVAKKAADKLVADALGKPKDDLGRPEFTPEEVTGVRQTQDDIDREFETFDEEAPFWRSDDEGDSDITVGDDEWVPDKIDVDNPKEFKLFRESGLHGGSWGVRFYSPALNYVDGLPYGEKGMTGANLISHLNKNPKIRKASIKEALDSIDPNKRYLRDEAIDHFINHSDVPSVSRSDKYWSSQRIPEGGFFGKERDYYALSLDMPGYRSSDNHFNPNTIAHTRLSIRDNPQLGEYILVEELQSDAVNLGEMANSGVSGVTDYVRPLVHTIISDAKQKGFKTVVFPDVDTLEIAREGQGASRKALENTYENSLNKVLKELEREQGVDIKVSKKKFSSGSVDVGVYEKELNKLRETRDAVNKELSEAVAPYRVEFDKKIKEAKEKKEAILAALPEKIRNSPSNVVDDIEHEYAKTIGLLEEEYLRIVQEFLRERDEKWGSLNADLELAQEKYVKEKSKSGTITILDISKVKDGEIRFNEGGYVKPMNDQMKFAFMADGGMAEENLEVDPVSGNEIPPGSTAKEVRDDIDVKLSEGEYVVPADVLQYYGLKFFEDLRNQAKEALHSLDKGGRIGGQPSSEPLMEEGDELPFSDEELMFSEEEDTKGFAAGGLNTTGLEKELKAVDLKAPTSYDTYLPPGIISNEQYVTKTFVNASGSTLQILFVNGQPNQPIPPGYTEQGKVTGKPGTFGPGISTEFKDSGADQRKSDEYEKNSGFNTDPKTWDTKDFENYPKQEGFTNALGTGLGLVNPLMGKMVKTGYQITGKNAAEEIAERLKDPNLSAEERARLEKAQAGINEIVDKNKKKGTGKAADIFDRIFGKKDEEEEKEKDDLADKIKDDVSDKMKDRPKEERTRSKPDRSSPDAGGFDKDKGGYGHGPMKDGGLVKRRKKY